MLGLQSHTLDFEILPTSNSKVLIFLDESQYFENPELPLLKITPPGYSRFFQTNIENGKINVLNSHLIGYTEVLESDCLIDLPDGIWTLVYMICPYEFLQIKKYHLRTTLLNEKISSIYTNIDNCDEIISSCIKEDLINIHILLESAKANAEIGNLPKATKDFSLAQTKVSKLLDLIYKKNKYAL